MDNTSNEVTEILKLLKQQNVKVDIQKKLISKLIQTINDNTIDDQNILNQIKSEIRKFTIFSNPDLMNLNRANTVLVSSATNPVFTLSNSIQYVTRVSESGLLYSIDTPATSVAANGFLCIQLTNPANSNKTLYINAVTGGATTNTTIDIIKNATFSATGTAMTPLNNNWSYSNSSSATAKYLTQSTDPTTGGSIIRTIIQTGGIVISDYWGALIIPSSTSNRQFFIRLVNNTNQVNILAISVSWWEEVGTIITN